jgi:hypothetical protein
VTEEVNRRSEGRPILQSTAISVVASAGQTPIRHDDPDAAPSTWRRLIVTAIEDDRIGSAELVVEM